MNGTRRLARRRLSPGRRASNILSVLLDQGAGGSGGRASPAPGGGRVSPGGGGEKEERPQHRGGGLSCLASHTLDEDREPLVPASGAAGFKSPEKKQHILSPSGRSISDIFGKVSKEKLFNCYWKHGLYVICTFYINLDLHT